MIVIKKIEPDRGWIISFVQDDTLRDFLGFKPSVIYEEYITSDKPVDILSFDNIFLETDIAQEWFLEATDLQYFAILQSMLILLMNFFKNFEQVFNGI